MTDFLWIAVIATLAIIAVGGFAVDHLLKLLRRRRAVQKRLLNMMPARSLCCGAKCKPLGWTADGWVATCRSCGAWQYLGDDHDNPPGGFEISGKAKQGWHSGGIVKSAEPRRDRFIGKHPALGAPYGFAQGGYVRDLVPLREDEIPYHFTAEVTSDEPYYPVGKARIQAELTYRLGIDEGEPLAVPAQPNIGGEGHPEYKGPHYESDDVPEFIPYDMKLDNPNRPDGVAVMPAQGEDDADDISPD